MIGSQSEERHDSARKSLGCRSSPILRQVLGLLDNSTHAASGERFADC